MRTPAEVLEHTDSVRDVLATLARPSRPPVRGINDPLWNAIAWPAAKTARLAVLGMLGPRMRHKLALDGEWSRGSRLAFRTLAASQRTVTPVVPRVGKDFGAGILRRGGLGRIIGGQLNQVARDKSGRQSQLAQDLDQQPGRIPAGTVRQAECFLRRLDARLQVVTLAVVLPLR